MAFKYTSRFNPFTFDELVKPLQEYGKAYKEAEDAYTLLTDNTEILRNEVDNDPYSRSYQTFHSYVDQLESAVGDFSKGMTGANRVALNKLRARYARDIAPISQASKKKQELAKEQRDILTKDPTRIFEKNAKTMSIDEFVDNPSADYGESISGATLQAQVSQACTALAKRFRDNSTEARGILGDDFYEYVKEKGFTAEAVMAAIANTDEASPILRNILDNVVTSSGILAWGSDNDIRRAYEYASNGLWSSIGESDSQVLQNYKRNISYQYSTADQYNDPSRNYLDLGDGEYVDPTTGVIFKDSNGKKVVKMNGDSVATLKGYKPKSVSGGGIKGGGYTPEEKAIEKQKEKEAVRSLHKETVKRTHINPTAENPGDMDTLYLANNGASTPKSKYKANGEEQIMKAGNIAGSITQTRFKSLTETIKNVINGTPFDITDLDVYKDKNGNLRVVCTHGYLDPETNPIDPSTLGNDEY